MNENLKPYYDQLIDVCHRLCAKGFVTATDGNVSTRLEDGHVLTTRTSINKGMVTEEDIVEVDQEGRILTPGRKPSTEFGMHRYIYGERPDVGAVVHAHPTYATGFATAHQPLTACLLPEVIVGLGAIPLAEYGTPSTEEIARSLSPFIRSADAVLLANHGVVTYGRNLLEAYFRMEKVEHAAHIIFVARMLGGERVLSQEDVEKLRAISQTTYGKDLTGKISCDTPAAEPGREVSDTDLRRLIRQMIGKNQP
jgi:L-fuculose-phosphate aldolase